MRRRHGLLCTAALLLAATSCSSAFTADERTPAARYLDEVLAVMQTHAYARASKDWTAIRTAVQATGNGAQTIEELAPAIRQALAFLGDGHSTYTSVRGTVLFVATRSCTAPTAATPEIPTSIGYVRVGSFTGTSSQADAYMAAIRNSIATSSSTLREGWIVDLRGNGGGNMWPMIAGVGPILGEGTAGYFVEANGAFSEWSYHDDAAYLSFTALARATVPVTLPTKLRVAVLQDGRTASSGEATVIAFRGRPDTRSFGTATCGLSTANSSYALSDGATLNLTTALMADRTKKAYGDVVLPDEAISGDAAVTRAIQWIRTGQ